jgi:hypothetical protein
VKSDSPQEDVAADPEAELARAEQSLERALLAPKEAPSNQEHPVIDPTPRPPPSDMTAGPDCETACEALGSIRRAAARICEISGPGERCTSARERLDRAEKRVQEACPECAS